MLLHGFHHHSGMIWTKVLAGYGTKKQPAIWVTSEHALVTLTQTDAVDALGEALSVHRGCDF
jgi:hypothetical protein